MFKKIKDTYFKAQSFIEGKKTYIIGTTGCVVAFAWLFGFIPDDVAIPLLNLCGFGGLVTLRSAITNKDK